MQEQIVVVGLGEVGRRIAQAAESLGLTCRSVTRQSGSEWLRGPRGVPLVVCVRETDLAGVLSQIGPERSDDLVVVQNGFIDELLAPYPGVTRAVLWFTAKQTFFADLLPSPIHGPREVLMRRLLTAAGASAEGIADPEVFRRYAFEKAIWSCVVGAPLAVWGVDLATARHERMGEIEAIVSEACDVVRVAQGVEITRQRVLATLDDTSTQLGWMRGGVHAVAWRNGKLVEWGARCGVPTPANESIARAASQPAAVQTAAP